MTPVIETYANNEILEIAPCTMEIIQESGILKTIVGSGVSVCLFDRRKRIAAMNHFLFPRTDELQKATGRYGNAALIGLLSLFDKQDEAASLSAFIAGGAYCDEFEMDVAIDNIRIAWKFLLVKHIPVISQNLGGCSYKEVSFDVATGVFMAKNLRMIGAL
jgi:chemotaxis protein CheD